MSSVPQTDCDTTPTNPRCRRTDEIRRLPRRLFRVRAQQDARRFHRPCFHDDRGRSPGDTHHLSDVPRAELPGFGSGRGVSLQSGSHLLIPSPKWPSLQCSNSTLTEMSIAGPVLAWDAHPLTSSSSGGKCQNYHAASPQGGPAALGAGTRPPIAGSRLRPPEGPRARSEGC